MLKKIPRTGSSTGSRLIFVAPFNFLSQLYKHLTNETTNKKRSGVRVFTVLRRASKMGRKRHKTRRKHRKREYLSSSSSSSSSSSPYSSSSSEERPSRRQRKKESENNLQFFQRMFEMHLHGRAPSEAQTKR